MGPSSGSWRFGRTPAKGRVRRRSPTTSTSRSRRRERSSRRSTRRRCVSSASRRRCVPRRAVPGRASRRAHSRTAPSTTTRSRVALPLGSRKSSRSTPSSTRDPTRIDVFCPGEADRFVLEVNDDGVGIDTAAGRPRGPGRPRRARDGAAARRGRRRSARDRDPPDGGTRSRVSAARRADARWPRPDALDICPVSGSSCLTGFA